MFTPWSVQMPNVLQTTVDATASAHAACRRKADQWPDQCVVHAKPDGSKMARLAAKVTCVSHLVFGIHRPVHFGVYLCENFWMVPKIHATVAFPLSIL